MSDASRNFFFPAIVCAEFDSPIDALVSLCVPYDEAMNLVASMWRSDDFSCVAATIKGGRTVAALRTEAGRWAACNAFPEHGGTTRSIAAHGLEKLLRRGRRGYVGVIANGTD